MGTLLPLHPMRRLILCALLVLPVAARAQRTRPFAEKGDVALVVGISPVSFPAITSALDGIGVRYRATDRSVIGVSAGFTVGTVDQDDSDDEFSGGSGRISVWNENHLGRSRGIVSPFVGAGLTAGLARETVSRDNVPFPCDPGNCPDEPVTAVLRQSRYSVGVGAILGAEVRVARGVTLGAAYTLGVSVERLSFTDTSPFRSDNEARSTVVAGGTGLTNLQLSVYF